MSASQTSYDVIVVGAGLTGLTAAYQLSRNSDLRIGVLEQSGRVGGVIQTVRMGGYQLEYAANTFLSTADVVVSLCDELGLETVRASAQAKKRYVYHKKKLAAVPTNPLAMLTTPLLSFSAKGKVLMEPFCKKHDGGEETVAEFTRRRLGGEVLDHLMGPFLSGVYAGDPEQLSLPAVFPLLAELEQEHGSVIRGMMARKKSNSGNKQHNKQIQRKKTPYGMLSFEGGMETLTQALGEKLPPDAVHLNQSVVSIHRTQDATERYQLKTASGETYDATGVIVTVPAKQAARMLEPLSIPRLSSLSEIPYVPMAVVYLGIDATQVDHALDGFGFLVPRKAGVQTLGAIWSSSLFPDRVPEGKVLFTAFIGGALQPDVADWTETQIIEQVSSDLAMMVNGSRSFLPELTHVKLWHEAIPQYLLGHTERMATVVQACPSSLVLGGNYRGGVSIHDCVRNGMAHAETMLKALKTIPEPAQA